MRLEVLPNEIFLETFEYFNGIDLLRLFYGLNSRLNDVLHDRFLHCSFDFHSISKGDFDTICHRYLPTMSTFITSLHLAENEDTPQAVQLFLSSIRSIDQLIELEMLSLSHLRSYQTVIQILQGCQHLTQLSFFHCYLQDDQMNFQSIIDQIWILPKLRQCTMGITIKGQNTFCLPTRTSSSLEQLSIERIPFELNQINRLFEFTPNLRCLSLSVRSFLDNHYQAMPLPTLTDLTIHSFMTCNAAEMASLLENTPNVLRLNIDFSCEIIDGNQLEDIIRRCLPELTKIELKMKQTLPLGQDLSTRVVTLLTSFQTPFWIDEHSWFVRCLVSQRTISLLSLSKPYDEHLPVTFHSTFPHDDQRDFYSHITKIISPTFFDQPIVPHSQFPRLTDLHLNLPISEHFWHLVPDLTRLQSLTISFHANTFRQQVQVLLDRASHLQRLTIHQYEPTSLQTSLFKYRNESIRELDLREMNQYFNEKDSTNFTRSPLAARCEKLAILICNRRCVLTLIENLHRLRILNVRCQEESSIYSTTSNNNEDECIHWLKDRLPSRSVIIRDPKLTCNILIWV